MSQLVDLIRTYPVIKLIDLVCVFGIYLEDTCLLRLACLLGLVSPERLFICRAW